VIGQQVLAMLGAGAVLGPLLDHQHSRFDVLHYTHPLLLRLPDAVRAAADMALPPPLRGAAEALAWRESAGLETAAWVPPLFACAAVVIGLGHTLGDDVMAARAARAAAEEVEAEREPRDDDAPEDSADVAPPAPGESRLLAVPRTGFDPSWRAVSAAVSAFALQYYLSGASYSRSYLSCLIIAHN
jgi:hypothetical protein